MRPRNRSYQVFVPLGVLLAGVLLTTCNRPTPTVSPTAMPPVIATVPASEVRRELVMVWAGPGGTDLISLPRLEDSEWHELPAGGWVYTDDAGEGWVRISDCMLIYIFQQSRLIKAACPKSDYLGGNVTCAVEGSSVYNNQCASQIVIQTPSVELVLEGTWLSVTYLPEQQLSLIMVFEGQVSAHPVLNVDTYEQGAAVDIAAGYFWFSTPGATAEPIAGLAARESHSFDQLLPVVEELNLWQWIERITLRADMDGIPYPAIPPFVLGPTLTPSLETATLISQLTSVPPTSTATPCGPPANWVAYVVQANDTLFSLAAQTGTSVARVKRANCLVGDTISIGQRLYLPSIPPTATPTATPTTTPTATPCGPPPNWVAYVVQANDTLFSLATKTGTSVEQVKQANCLVDDTLFIGQSLYLPFIPPTPTDTPTSTSTITPTPSETPSPTPTSTATPTPTSSPTSTFTPSPTPSPTPTTTVEEEFPSWPIARIVVAVIGLLGASLLVYTLIQNRGREPLD
jgi:LysM repeat protein